jgi:NAD(P)-dependent dehydrogenase (short-subunit alcohol dehydrogenase family)
MSRIDGKVALIIGAARGISAETALLFARSGARLVLNDREESGLEATAKAIRDLGAEAIALPFDVRNEPDWEQAMATATSRFGGLDVLVNNAGTTWRRNLEDLTVGQWRHVLSVNLDGAFLGIKHGIRAMRERGGSIVNMRSVLGRVGASGFAAYGASKGGLLALTKAAAVECAELGYPIRINLVAPGFIRTKMTDIMIDKLSMEERNRAYAALAATHPLERLGRPADIADAVLFLASEDASYMTGAELVVDGGYSAL